MKKIIIGVIIVFLSYGSSMIFAENMYNDAGILYGTRDPVTKQITITDPKEAPPCTDCNNINKGVLYKDPNTNGAKDPTASTPSDPANPTAIDPSTSDLGIGSANNGSAGASAPQTAKPAGPTTIIVTEEIPGGNCECIEEYSFTTLDDNYGKQTSTIKQNCSNPATRKYKCTIQPGLVGFQQTFAAITKYVIYITMLLGVLGIVGLGIAWSFAGGDDIKAKSSLKKWGVNILVGLTLLFLFSYILRFLAPWIYQ